MAHSSSNSSSHPWVLGGALSLLLGLSSIACTVTSSASGTAAAPANPGQPGPVASMQPVPVPPAAVPPQTAEGCRACNGLWAVHGLAQVESCVCRTTDGGKRCRDGVECQGMCLAAEDPEREVVQAGPSPRGFFIGRCSDLVTVFGCNRVIDRGAAKNGPMPLSEPPTSICVD